MMTMRIKTFIVSWLATALIAASLVAPARPRTPAQLPDSRISSSEESAASGLEAGHPA